MSSMWNSPRSFMARDLSPTWVEINGAMLTEPAFDMSAVTFSGAAYRSDGGIVVESLRPSAIGHWRPVDPVTVPPLHLQPDLPNLGHAIYGGHFFTMWGHFVMETLSTAFVASDLPDIPVVFTSFVPDEGRITVTRDWNARKGILSAAGWGSRPLLLQEGAVRFDRLYVPERLCVVAAEDVHNSVAPSMATVYGRCRSAVAAGIEPHRVVVARRPDWFTRKHPAEDSLYEHLAAHGFHIMNGALMSWEDQIKVLASASALIGFTGSNLHNCVFSWPGIRVLELGDQRSYASADHLNRNQISLCGVMSQQLEFVETYEDPYAHVPSTARQIMERVEAFIV